MTKSKTQKRIRGFIANLITSGIHSADRLPVIDLRIRHLNHNPKRGKSRVVFDLQRPSQQWHRAPEVTAHLMVHNIEFECSANPDEIPMAFGNTRWTIKY